MARLTTEELELRAALERGLVAARTRAGLTQSQLSHALRTNEMQVSRWERGESTPSACTLLRIARILGVSVESLFGEGK